MSAFEDRLKTGNFGERIIDEFLRQKGWVPYRPVEGAAHPFDRLVASKDKQRLCIVEVKTKWRREAYADTGINRRCFNDYQNVTTKYSVPLFLVFVDAKQGTVYGNWWAELLKPRGRYPWEQSGVVYFPLDSMRTLHVLTETDRAELKLLRVSDWTPVAESRSKQSPKDMHSSMINWGFGGDDRGKESA